MGERASLLLRLEGPLQSWGERARWDIRDTADHPTRSGVLGMIACALGYPRRDPRILSLGESLRYGVRVDRAGTRLEDYHTVRGQHPSAEGELRGTPENPYTIVSRRAYLQDASFLAGLEGPEEVLRSCEAALRQPRWPYFLGRRSCPPSAPVLVGLRSGVSLEEALREPSLDPIEQRPRDTRCVVYLEDPRGEHQVRDRDLGRPAREYALTRYRRQVGPTCT